MRVLLLISAGLLASCMGISNLEQAVVTAIKSAQIKVEQTNQKVVTMKATGMVSQKANSGSQFEQLKGDLLSEVTKQMVTKMGVTVLPELAELDMDSLMVLANKGNGTRSKRYAKDQPSTTMCTPDNSDCNSKEHTEFRSVTGICNNRASKTEGAALSAVRRLIATAKYDDGFSSPRSKAVSGSLLPSAREVSNKIHEAGQDIGMDLATNHLHMQFGQMVAHDIIFMPSSVGPSGESLDCSACNSDKVTENCAPIKVPDDDKYFPENSCIRLTRSLNSQKGLGQRQQLNQNTQFLDMSTVYGSEECEAKSVRSFKNGELKTFNNELPPQNPNDTNCQSKAPFLCFTAGDFRNTLHPGLAPLHTVFIKEHNRLARKLKQLKPEWNDERLFQVSRKAMIAQYQHQVYNEYLPKLLGAKTMNEFDLYPKKAYYTTAGSTVGPSMEFGVAAFRLHSQVRKDFPRMTNKNGTVASPVDIGANTFYAESQYKDGGPVSLLEGMIQHYGMKIDRKFSFPIRNQLFEIRGKPASGVDLVAVNIMRGRDVGLHPYNEYRKMVGLQKANSFDDLSNEMEKASVDLLKKTYGNVNDIDLFTGIMNEKPFAGSMMGRTGSYIIGESFRALKRGDRFYYENNLAGTTPLTLQEIATVYKSSLARMVCEMNDTIKEVNKDIFDLNSQRVSCDSVAALDATPFSGVGGTLPPLSPSGPPSGVPPLSPSSG